MRALLLSLCFLAVTASAQPSAPDRFAGTWTLVAEQSSDIEL